MKKISILIILSLIQSAAGAFTLVKAVSSPGFVFNPEARTFVLDSSGRMTLTIKDLRAGSLRIERLGQISLVEMTKIKMNVASAAGSVLVDDQPDGPICADVPEYTVSFFKNAISKPVFRTAQCHSFHLDGYEGQRTVDLALAFLKL